MIKPFSLSQIMLKHGTGKAIALNALDRMAEAAFACAKELGYAAQNSSAPV